MKRVHLFYSSLGIVLTAFLLLGLAFMLWRDGGMAFSPGRLSAKSVAGITLNGFVSHAEFEKQCELCHAPLETTQDKLCLACHEVVGLQIASEQGTHGRLENAGECAKCHSDHHGNDFDLLMPALDQFDHSVTTFSLIWHQVNYDTTSMNCDACHRVEQQFLLDQEKCLSCHQDHDPMFMIQHEQDFGGNCLDCHDGHDRLADFDHASTDFPIDGKHSELRCGKCHLLDGNAQAGLQMNAAMERVFEITFQNISIECIACHTEPAVHQGVFETNCANCHTTTGWSPAIWAGNPFEHAQTTGFSLVRHMQKEAGSRFICKDCHQDDVRQFDLSICVFCHSQGVEQEAFMVEHQTQFGPACLDCHDGVDRMSDFDHANFYPLNGIHTDLNCEKCHADQLFRGTPRLCVECHAEPAIHAGFFGAQCQNCHTEDSWSPARMRIHHFPLDHGRQGTSDCKTCHTAAYEEYTCYGCHDHQPDQIRTSHLEELVSLEELPNCTQCHPAGLKEEPKNP